MEMEHQDWNIVKINASNKSKKPQQPQQPQQPPQSQQPQMTTKIIMKEPLGKLIAQARVITGKTQKDLASMVGISQQVLSRWEANKELPSNAQIALLEKTLKVKLPRTQKVYIKEN
jgi:ribosome-binding protein aMBF1 (putative translation factor)